MTKALFEMNEMNSGAEFSDCRTYRYSLWRIWDKSKPLFNVIGLNPSTANETDNDPTVRRCINFAKDLGYGGLLMSNIFAFRATLPKDMKKATDPIGKDNDAWLESNANRSGIVVAAWGVDGSFNNRDKAVIEMIPDLYCFRLTAKSGVPEHPLYLPKNLVPVKLQEAKKFQQ